MTTTTPGRIFTSCCLYLALLGGVSAAGSKSEMTPMGDNTYAITRTATNGFNRDVNKLKAEAQEDAAQFCAAQGKQLKVVAVASDRPHIGGGYSSARVVFKALNPGEVEAAAPAPAALPGINLAAPASAAPSGDLYAELLKLDDLRKKGILTDKEFESEKKKVLKRSK